MRLTKMVDKIVVTNFYNKPSFCNEKDVHQHKFLCNMFNVNATPELVKAWHRYWAKADVENNTTIGGYCKDKHEACLLRLLIVEDFKQWLIETGRD